MKLHVGLAVVTLSMTVACGQRALDRERATVLIKDLDGFKGEPFFWIRTNMPFRSTFKCETQAEVERAPLHQFLTRQGWVRYETRSTVVGFDTKVSCPSLTLTPAGDAASARWTKARGSMAGESSWAVPIGRRELVAVTGLTSAPDGSTSAEFEWRWVANDIGTALRQSIPGADSFFDRTRKGHATCRRYDDGWRCTLGMWPTPADALGEFAPPLFTPP
jgi:hypothetical protein